ncbi:MAG: PD40 domain-containing protein [Acidobacteria bacterium]|nr:PD40 domain-containing protein [Acidobacteriota bacterium]
MPQKVFRGLVLVGVLGMMLLFVPAQTKLLRFPDIHQDHVVFCYAGDLWIAGVEGGLARRLTAHPGQELFPKFSPDGRHIAFTGQYDGDEQIYVMPAEGGIPQQLTFYPARGPLPPRWGYDNQVYGWTPDGKKVLFRSLRDGWDLGDSRLYTVPLTGGLPEPLPMPFSGAGDLSPDGRKVIYSPLFRDFRTWKRYEGGWAQDLFIFDMDARTAVNITRDVRSDRDPMWIGDAIYFASDRTGTLNLYRYDPATKETTRLTESTRWDVRWPSSDGVGQIVYEMNGELQIFDIASGVSRAISIRVPDDGLAMRPSRISAARNIEDFGLSPKGERALFTARGDIFSVPAKKGHARNLTDSSGAHDKLASWSPDGSKIVFISDRTGEEELWLINQDGSGESEQLTFDGKAMRYQPEWSPDGQYIAFSDKDGRLYMLTVADKKVQEVTRDKGGNLRDYTWSPDSGYLAFSLTDPNGFNALHIWSRADGRLQRVTGEHFNERQPVWDPDGAYLYYLADHQFAPQISRSEWNFATDRMTGIYALALRQDVKHPFPPESDEVTVEKEKEADKDNGKEDKEKADSPKKEEKAEKEEAKKEKTLKIDFEGLAQRVTRIPVDEANYVGLSAVKGHLVYAKTGAPFYGRQSPDQPEILVYNLKDRKEQSLASGIAGYALSADGKKILVRQGRSFNLYDLPPKGKDAKETVSTAELMVNRVPAEEWSQIFNEVWRRFRDFFYVENMHGYDWETLREQYTPWLEHVAHRSDLNYVIGEMIAELNVGHAYIQGGDYDIPDRAPVALPGARFAVDTDSGRYQIAMVFEGENQEAKYRSPLTEVGVDIKVGDYVLAIDGEDLTVAANPYRLLRNKGNRPVTFTVNDKPTREGARDVTFVPLTSESSLVYRRWVERCRQQVTEMSNGRVGYLHIPDMGADGSYEFIKWFYPLQRKDGLIIDVRGNGGGNISAWVIERLQRKLLGTGFGRTSDYVGTYPGAMHYGPKVCLISETSASDGDIFPYMFRQAGLGSLIGKRTWGGVVGITGHGALIDGGQVFVPEFSSNDVEGNWAIEGEGVRPDIEVENNPISLLAGKDLQLERAVQEVLELLKSTPHKLPERPAPPVKTR